MLTPGRLQSVTAYDTCITTFLDIRNKLVTHTLGNIVFSGVLILLCNERGELNRVQFLNKHTDIEGFQLYTGRCKVKDD